jgi:hypothetical protein
VASQHGTSCEQCGADEWRVKRFTGKRPHRSCVPCENQRARQRHTRKPYVEMYKSAKKRAKRDGLPFDIAPDDVQAALGDWSCAYCGCETVPVASGGGGQRSPTLDRLYPALGYVKGNIAVACMTCNRMKQDLTPRQMRRLAARVDEIARANRLIVLEGHENHDDMQFTIDIRDTHELRIIEAAAQEILAFRGVAGPVDVERIDRYTSRVAGLKETIAPERPVVEAELQPVDAPRPAEAVVAAAEITAAPPAGDPADLFRSYAQEKGVAAASALLAKFGVRRFSELSTEQQGALVVEIGGAA